MTVVACQADLAAAKEIVEPTRVGFVPKPEEHTGRNVPVVEAAAQQGERGDADTAADQNRARRPRRELPRRGKPVSEGAVEPDSPARFQGTEPLGSRTDSLEQEIEADSLVHRV